MYSLYKLYSSFKNTGLSKLVDVISTRDFGTAFVRTGRVDCHLGIKLFPLQTILEFHCTYIENIILKTKSFERLNHGVFKSK